MKISINWLKEYVETDLSILQIIDALNSIGLLVDSWEEHGGDAILEIETYANRPDTLGHLGVARELAACLGAPFKNMDWPLTETEKSAEEQVDIQIWEEDLCPRYSGIVVHRVKVGPSPDWLREKIDSMGLKPINNVVDVSNCVLFATSHPVHFFDLAKIAGRKIIIRKAKKGESFRSLEGETISLFPDMLVIADEEKPIALAGVIGGEHSAVSASTEDVFIESACFDPVSIRKTSKLTGIQTDASYRFERGADISFPPQAALMAASLLTQLGGRAAKGRLDVYPRPRKDRTVVLRHHRIAELLGLEIDADFVLKILSKLGFKAELKQQGIWQIKVPTFRIDIEREADLIEEVARFYGYDKIPSQIPPLKTPEPPVSPKRTMINALRKQLIRLGFDEVLNFSFSDLDKEVKFQTGLKPIEIKNPISSKASLLKTTLVGGLLDTVSWNRNRGADGIHVYEVGNIYFWDSDVHSEQLSLAAATTGEVGDRHWQKKNEKTDFFRLKGACEDILSHLGYKPLSFQMEDYPKFEPKSSLTILFKGEKIGCLGLVHRDILESYSLKDPVWAAEMNLSVLFEKQPQPFQFKPVIKYPSISRDVSFIASQNVCYQDIKTAIEKLALPLLERFELYDRFSGAAVPPGKVSLSFRFIFRHPSRTLLAEDVDILQQKIVKALKTQFHFQLREGGEN